MISTGSLSSSANDGFDNCFRAICSGTGNAGIAAISFRSESISSVRVNAHCDTMTTPDRVPAATRDSIKSATLVTQSAIPTDLSLSVTVRFARIKSATSATRAASPQLMKCQYFFDEIQSTAILPANSARIRRAESKPRDVEQIPCGINTCWFRLCGIMATQTAGARREARLADAGSSSLAATITNDVKPRDIQLVFTASRSTPSNEL